MKVIPTTVSLRIYTLLAGVCDTITGLLLVFAPAWTLCLMGIKKNPDPIEFAAFIGVFVLAVGLAYLCIACSSLTRLTAPRWQVMWWWTALSRSLVAAFLTWKILAGRLETVWLSVALTDGLLAGLQWAGLACGWLDVSDE